MPSMPSGCLRPTASQPHTHHVEVRALHGPREATTSRLHVPAGVACATRSTWVGRALRSDRPGKTSRIKQRCYVSNTDNDVSPNHDQGADLREDDAVSSNSITKKSLPQDCMPLVLSRDMVAENVRYSSSLYNVVGREAYVAAMEHWHEVLPERLPGLQSRVVTGLQVEPGVLVVRWQSQWPAPTLWSGVRDVHQAYHKLADGQEAEKREEEEKAPVAQYVVFGSSRILTDENGLVFSHQDTIDFEPEGPQEAREWALFDYCMARCGPGENSALWGWMVLKLFIYETLKGDETFGEELKTMSAEERDTAITQTIFVNILVTALAAGLAALVLVKYLSIISSLLNEGIY